MTHSQEIYGQVAIFEDNFLLQELLYTLVTFCKHNVPIQATTVGESISLIDDRVKELGHLGLDAVLLDGNLDSGGEDNRDGCAIAKHLRSLPGGSKDDLHIVSFSSTGMFPGSDAAPEIEKEAFEAVRLADDFIKQKLGIA